jgi:MYXO-CTERM domain-containing protein
MRAVLCLILLAAAAHARVPGYPHLSNETIGQFRIIAEAVEGPVDVFEERYWGLGVLEAVSGGDAMSPLRYLLAFSAYGVAQTAHYTPAWRAPYQRAYEGYVARMLQPLAWQDWLTEWGGSTPLGPDNIMYTGHLALMFTLHRQVFGEVTYEAPVQFGLTDGSATFETDVHSLTDWLSQQAAEVTDNHDARTYNIACEPGRMFVPCNTPHRISQLAYDGMFGTDYAASNPQWSQWVQDRMLEPETGVLYDLYWPFGPHQATRGEGEPAPKDRLSGLYNAWTIWALFSIDPPLAQQLYPAFKAQFLKRGPESPFADGRPVIVDGNATGLAAFALDSGATGFGMIAVAVAGEHPLLAELIDSWARLFGPATWDDTHRSYGHRAMGLPLLYQNGFVLLANTSSPAQHLGTMVSNGFDAARFEAPYLARVSAEGTFINQAIYDPTIDTLVLTLNGGDATADRADLTVTQLDPETTYEVMRDGVRYPDWDRRDDTMTIHSPALSPNEETYLIRPRTTPIEPDAGVPDAAAPDASPPDAAQPDATWPDASPPDAAAPDAGPSPMLDATPSPDAPAAQTDANASGCDCQSTPAAPALWMLALGLLAIRPRRPRA